MKTEEVDRLVDRKQEMKAEEVNRLVDRKQEMKTGDEENRDEGRGGKQIG